MADTEALQGMADRVDERKLPPMSPNTARQLATGTPRVAARRARLHDAAPGARAQGMAVRRGIVFADDGPRLHRCAGDAVDPAVERHHVPRELFRGAFACVLGAVTQDEARTFGRGSTLPLGP